MSHDPNAGTAARMTFCYPGCKHDYCATYDKGGEGKCWELWHPEFRSNGPYCQQDAGHEGLHRGGGMEWFAQSHADPAIAARFLSAYRAIPNGFHELWLRDDGYVEGTVRGLESAVRFVGLRMSDD